jgi:hypothetical protein
MNIFKIPVNFLVVFLLLYMNRLFSLRGLIMISFCFSFIVLVLHFTFFLKDEEKYGPYAELKKRNQVSQEQRETAEKKTN